MRITWLLVAVFLLGTSPVFSADLAVRPESWATAVESELLGNWYRVDARLYRSEQPDASGMAALEDFGIRRVLNLRQFHDDVDEAEGSGLELHHVPFNAALVKDAYIVEALKIITASEEPILVHCWHGSDRTGTVVAMYRIVEQGWSKEAAIDELKNGGYGYHAIYGNIVEYLEDVDVAGIRGQVYPDRAGNGE